MTWLSRTDTFPFLSFKLSTKLDFHILEGCGRKGKASKDNSNPSYRKILCMGIFSLTLSRRATEVGAGGFFYLEESKNNCFKETLGEGTNN
jgi:hypothetical protein